jgi:spermidine synthase
LLLSLLGVYTRLLVAGLALLGLAVAIGRFWRSAPAMVVAVIVAGGAVYALNAREAVASQCYMETNYFCIKVHSDQLQGQPVKALVLDHLIHSYVKLGDPSFLGYPHEQVQAEFTRYAGARNAAPHVLVIGGGGYTFPRWVEAYVPSATVEVVEIDPGVTETVYRELGLSRNTRIVSYPLDGRQFVHELAPRDHYQLVVQDAVNDLSVPYHIMTKEYDDYVRDILTDDGIFLLTVIDLHDEGQLMRSAVRTMMRSFPEVRLLDAAPQWDLPGASVFVIAGSKKRIDLDDMRAVLQKQGVRMQTIAQPDDDLRVYVAKDPQIVLTDEYAPVDNLISILFRNRN